jgi:hypothetical protein
MLYAKAHYMNQRVRCYSSPSDIASTGKNCTTIQYYIYEQMLIETVAESCRTNRVSLDTLQVA